MIFMDRRERVFEKEAHSSLAGIPLDQGDVFRTVAACKTPARLATPLAARWRWTKAKA